MTLPSASIEVRVDTDGARTFLRPAVVIGRNPGSDVVIDDPVVSLRHCDILIGEDGTSIADCGSANGTYYDATRIGTMLLAPGRVYTFRLGAPNGVAIYVSTNVPLRGPASRTSSIWERPEPSRARPSTLRSGIGLARPAMRRTSAYWASPGSGRVRF